MKRTAREDDEKIECCFRETTVRRSSLSDGKTSGISRNFIIGKRLRENFGALANLLNITNMQVILIVSD